ncbi:MAG: site-specific DNA-methyltransferase [Candidatus Aenigmatarchaeota archaeon]
MELDLELKQELMNLIKEGKPLPIHFRSLLFPPDKKPKEYELVYGIKEREEDILAETMAVPFQPVKQFGKVKEGEWHNKLIFGDNLQVLKHIKKLQDEGKMEKIKLIFIDPPFGTGDIYDAKGAPAYSAALQGAEYLEFLRKRLVLLREILADDGSIYVRIDYHFGHYVKVLMDEIFDKNNFRNEIVIAKSNRIKTKGNRFLSWHDILLVYAKNYNSVFFNHITKSRGKEEWRQMDNDGEQWSVVPKNVLHLHSQKNIKYDNMGNPISRAKIILGKEFLPPKGRRFPSQEIIFELEKENLIRLNINHRPIMKKPDEIPLTDNWTEISSYSSNTSYPTENSEELLDRVIRTSSIERDLILDCFAGSGTTGAVAEKIGRRWIMVDCGKLAIYTMIQRMHSLKEEIGNKGKDLKPKPFVLYNAGLYADHDILLKMGSDQYKKFALELFQCEPKETEINGLKMDGILLNCPVRVFSQEGYLKEEYINELHNTVGASLKSRMFIIAPASRVYFLQDYIEKGGIRYYILRIPYSVIDEIHKKAFTRPVQPTSSSGINQNIEAIGFDFIHPPEVKAEYYKIKPKDKLTGFMGGKELVIEIKKFEAVQRSKEPMEFKDPKDALSMVFIDRDYNGEYFNMTDYFFADDIKKQNYKIRIPAQTGEKIMIIYLDVLGNERIEVKKSSDFKKG